MLGDGSYLMLNSELATSVAMSAETVVVLLDNRGFLHQPAATSDRRRQLQQPASERARRRFRRARSLGADAERQTSLAEQAMEQRFAGPLVRRRDRHRSRGEARPVEPGGTLRSPKCRSARRSRRRARITTNRYERCGREHLLRREPDRLDQRRYAGAGRRDHHPPADALGPPRAVRGIPQQPAARAEVFASLSMTST